MKLSCLIFTLGLLLCLLRPAAAADPASVFHRAGNWQLHGDGPHHLMFGLGAFDVDENATGAAQLEFRYGRKLFFIGPAIGVLVNVDDGYFPYGGLYLDIAYRKLVLTLLGGAGAYEDGEGIDLGGTFHFRSEMILSWQFENGSRLGVQYGHISNGGTHEENPSEQDVFLNFSFPF